MTKRNVVILSYTKLLGVVMLCAFLVLDPALIGLSLAYGVSLSNIVQYSVRLSGEIENLVSHIAMYMCCYYIVNFYSIAK